MEKYTVESFKTVEEAEFGIECFTFQANSLKEQKGLHLETVMGSIATKEQKEKAQKIIAELNGIISIHEENSSNAWTALLELKREGK